MEIYDNERALFEKEREDYRELISGIKKQHLVENNNLTMTCIGNAGGSDAILHGQPSGGFLLAYDGRVIIVDPGENSVSFLHESGFDPYNITDVAASHAHNDHIGDLASAISAALKLNIDKNADPHFFVCPSIVDYTNADVTQYGFTLPAYAWNGNVNILSVDEVTINRFDGEQITSTKTVKLTKNIEVQATRGKHAEMMVSGFIFSTPIGKVSYTSDTEYFPELAEQYQGTEVLWMNMNSLGLDSFSDIGPTPQKFMPIHNHLGYVGVCNLIEAVKPRVAIVSHFGAQLLGRVDEIQSLFQKRFGETDTQVYCVHTGDEFCFNNTLSELPLFKEFGA